MTTEEIKKSLEDNITSVQNYLKSNPGPITPDMMFIIWARLIGSNPKARQTTQIYTIQESLENVLGALKQNLNQVIPSEDTCTVEAFVQQVESLKKKEEVLRGMWGARYDMIVSDMEQELQKGKENPEQFKTHMMELCMLGLWDNMVSREMAPLMTSSLGGYR